MEMAKLQNKELPTIFI